MAINTWSSAGSTDGSLGTNYSLAHVPTTGDAAVIDGTSVVNCTLTAAGFAPDSISATVAYTGTFNSASYDVATTGDQTWACTALNMGSGSWTCGGHWSHKNVTTFTRGTGILHITGAGATLAGTNVKAMGPLSIEANASFTGSTNAWGQAGDVTLAAGVTLTFAEEVRPFLASQVWTVPATAAIAQSGARTLSGQASVPTLTIDNDGTITLSQIIIRAGVVLSGSGIWNCDFTLDRGGGTADLTALNSITINGAFSYDTNGGSGTVDFATYDVDFGVTGSFTILNVGTIAWNAAATGSLIFSSSSDQTYNDAYGVNVGNVQIDKTAGNFVLASNMTCATFTGTSTGTGSYNLSGNTLDSTGAVSLASAFVLADPIGSTINCDTIAADGCDLIGSGTWYLNATSAGSLLHNLTVTNCDASGGADIDATDNCVDGGGNSVNINFGAAGAVMNQFQAVNLGADLFNGALL